MKTAAVLIVAVLAAQSFATTYYVSATGNDNAGGTTPQTAWQTLSRLGQATLSPGDNVFLHGGDSFSGSISVGVNNITVGSYGPGRPTIDAGVGDGIFVYDAAGATLENLVLKGGWNAGSQAGNTGAGVDAYCDIPGAVHLNGLTVNNLSVSGFKNGGISVGSYPSDGSKSGFSNVSITNCHAFDNGAAGITSWGYFDTNATTYSHIGFLVDHCTTNNNEGVRGTGNNSGNGIVLGDVRNATIQYCESYLNGELNDFSGGGPVGIWCWDSDNVTIQYCEAHNNRTATVDGDGFDLDGGTTNSTIQYCYSHDNDGAGFLVAEFYDARPLHGLTLRYNISQHDGRRGDGAITLWDGYTGIHNVQIYNNTLYATNPEPDFHFLSEVDSVYLRNNAIVSKGSPLVVSDTPQVSAVFQGNAYWASGGSFSIDWDGSSVSSQGDWQALGQEILNGEPVGFFRTPDYVGIGTGITLGSALDFSSLNGYQVQSKSPLIGSGLPMEQFGVDPGLHDLFGTSLLSPPDIGATQAVGGR